MAGGLGMGPGQLAQPVPGAADQQQVTQAQDSGPDYDTIFKQAGGSGAAPAAPQAQPQGQSQQASMQPDPSQSPTGEPDYDAIMKVAKAMPNEVHGPQELSFTTAAKLSGADSVNSMQDRLNKDDLGELPKGTKVMQIGPDKSQVSFITPNGQEYRPSTDWKSLSYYGNHARQAIEMITAALPEATAYAAGATGIGAPAALPMLASGAMLGKAAGEAYSSVMGFQRDPNESPMKHALDYAETGGMGAAFGALANGVLESATGNISGQLSKIESTKAAMQAASDLADKADAPLQALRQSGAINSDQNKIYLTPDEMYADSKTFAEKLRGIRSIIGSEGDGIKQKLNDFLAIRGQQMGQVWDKIQQEVGANPNTGQVESDVGQQAKNYMDLIYKSEGNAIGMYRNKAIDANKVSGDMITPGATKGMLNGLATKLGYELDQSGRITKMPDVDEFMSNAQLTSEGEAKVMMGDTNRMLAKMYNSPDGMSLSDLNLLRKSFADKAAGYFDNEGASTQIRSYMSNMRKALTTDVDANMDKYISPGDMSAYQQSKQQYGIVKDGMEKFERILSNDNISSTAFAKQLFSGAATSPDKVQAAQQMIEANNPMLWRRIAGSHFDMVNESARDPATGKLDFGKLNKAYQGLINNGSMDSLLSGTGVKPEDMINFTNLAARIDKMDMNQLAQPQGLGNLKKLAVAVSHSAFAVGSKVSLVADGFLNAGRNKAVQKFIQERGYDDVLNAVPEVSQPWMRNIIGAAAKFGAAPLATEATKPGVIPQQQQQR